MSDIINLDVEQEFSFTNNMWSSELLRAFCGYGPMDRDKFQLALNDAYAVLGKPSPRLLVFNSPFACMTAMRDHVEECADTQLERSLSPQLRDQLWNPLLDQLRNQLGECIWVGKDLRRETRDLFESNYWYPYPLCIDRLQAQLTGQLGDQFGSDGIRDGAFLLKSHDLCWISLSTFAEWVGVNLKPETSHYLDIISRIRYQCDWWWPFDSVVIASERPVLVGWDDQNRLHCDDGAAYAPAVEYADGYKLFSWHGTAVPSHWIMGRDNLDPKDVMRQGDVEMRAAGAAIVGWTKMLRVLDYRVIDDSGNDDIGQLIELNFPGLGKPGRFLKAVCPRNGIFVEGVPRVSDIDNLPIETVAAAQAWLIGEPQSEYRHTSRLDKIRIIKLDALPEGMTTMDVEKVEAGWIIRHSDRGHHLILTGGDVANRIDNVPHDMDSLYAQLDKPASLIQDAPSPHEDYNLDSGIYCFRVAREYDPFAEQVRRVAD